MRIRSTIAGRMNSRPSASHVRRLPVAAAAVAPPGAGDAAAVTLPGSCRSGPTRWLALLGRVAGVLERCQDEGVRLDEGVRRSGITAGNAVHRGPDDLIDLAVVDQAWPPDADG